MKLDWLHENIWRVFLGLLAVLMFSGAMALGSAGRGRIAFKLGSLAILTAVPVAAGNREFEI